MKKSIEIKSAFSCGGRALDYLKQIHCKNVVIVRDREVEQDTDDILQKMKKDMWEHDVTVAEFSEISSRPVMSEIVSGIAYMKEKKPDMVVAIGSDAAINAAKIMLVLYEYPEIDFNQITETDMAGKSLHTRLVVMPASSESAQEVNQVTTIMIDSQDICSVL